MDIDPVLFAAAVMVASTPVALAALGELVVERAGVLNLGVEGMMITGAVCGYIIGHETGSAVAGFAGAALGGIALSVLFAFLTQVLLTNQVATGLAMTLFGLGLAALAGQGYVPTYPVQVPKIPVPVLSDIPIIGPVVFRHDMIVYLSLLSVAAVSWFLFKTRAGLILRAVGENHDAARAQGFNVKRIRLAAIMFGGACAGAAGAYVSLVRVPQWTDGITSGAGWIALAIVVFAGWMPGRLILGAYIFGGVTVLQLNLQAAGTAIPVQYLSMAPYIVTIIVLVMLSGSRAPGSLGRTFHSTL